MKGTADGIKGWMKMTNNYYYYYICLKAFFQDNPGKLAPEKQNHSGKTNLELQ